MPRYDGTGPEGHGAMTGRGFGWCIRQAEEVLAQRKEVIATLTHAKSDVSSNPAVLPEATGVQGRHDESQT